MVSKKSTSANSSGALKTESRQQQFARAQRFLDGNSPIKIGTLSHLVEFFEKPLAYFLPESSLYPTALNSAEKTTTTPGQPELKVIADNLRKLGLDEDFIKNQLRQIEAMEAYHGH